MRGKKIGNMARHAMFTALIAMLTSLIRLPIAGGYLHPGDAGIALAASALGPWAFLPAALGSAMADLMGYPQYAPFSLVIKGAEGFIAGWFFRQDRKKGRSALGLILASLALVGGYFLTDLLLGGLALALADLVWNVLQACTMAAAGLAALRHPGRRL